jgi:hypothetical protein
MKKPIHKLTDIDVELKIAYCSACQNLVKILPSKAKSHPDYDKYWRCKNNHRDTIIKTLYPYKLHKKDYCENPACTATILHKSQLSVDHIDGDRNNNEESNLQTLCLNCHSHKSFLNNDYLNKYD